ncbi:MAG: 4a-hydroxytetrahydrobiopterin dehydratase [Dehalococcoidia bacterium]
MARLSDQELQAVLPSLDGWHGDAAEIRRTYQFEDFLGSLAFVNRAAEFAEAAQHHPDIDIRYNKVTVALTTHDEGGVSDKDIALARKLNG